MPLTGGRPRKRPRRQRRALASVVGALATCMTIYVALSVWSLDWPAFVDPQFITKSEALARRLADASPNTPLVVMLGSSRTVFGFQGQVVEKSIEEALGVSAIAFELGLVARPGPVMQWIAFERLRRMGIRPTVLLLELYPGYLARDLVLDPPRFSEEERTAFQRFGLNHPGPRGEDPPPKWYSYRHAIVARLRPDWLPHATRMDWLPDLSPWGSRPLPATIANRPDIVANVRATNQSKLRIEEPGSAYDYWMRL